MELEVKLFAQARQLVGAEAVTLHLPNGATVGDVRRAVQEEYPAVGELLRRSLFAVNAEYAIDDTPVPPGAEVACIPPVSGG